MQRALTQTAAWILLAIFFLAPITTQSHAEEETAPAAESEAINSDSSDTIRLDFIPSDPALIIAIRPNDLFNVRQLKVFEDLLRLSGQYQHPVSITQIDQVTYVTEKREPGTEIDRPSLVFDLNILRSQSPIDWPKFIQDFSSSAEAITHQDVTYYKLLGLRNACMWPADDYTYIAGPEDSIRRAIERSNAESIEPPMPTAWPVVGESQFLIGMASDYLENQLAQTAANTTYDKAAMAANALKGLINDTDCLVLSLHMDEDNPLPMNMRFILGCSNEEAIEEKLKSLAGMNFLLRQLIMDDKRTREANGESEQWPSLSDAGLDLFKHTTRDKVDQCAVMTLAADAEAGNAAAFLVKLLAQTSGQVMGYQIARQLDMTTAPEVASITPSAIPPGVLNSPSMVARREASAERMQKIVKAMHIHAAEHGSFPRCSFDDQQRPLLSWRVHLLPALGYEELYNQFHLDEPWDSEHNRKLLSQMPAEYGGPSSTGTSPTSEHASMFLVLNQSEDSSANSDAAPSLVLVEARREVPWTQSDELALNEDGRLADQLRGWQPGGMMICPADGTAVFVISAAVGDIDFAKLNANAQAK